MVKKEMHSVLIYMQQHNQKISWSKFSVSEIDDVKIFFWLKDIDYPKD